jgi:hypothetical protein
LTYLISFAGFSPALYLTDDFLQTIHPSRRGLRESGIGESGIGESGNQGIRDQGIRPQGIGDQERLGVILAFRP